VSLTRHSKIFGSLYELALCHPSVNCNLEMSPRLGKFVESWCERYSVYFTAPFTLQQITLSCWK